MVRRPPASTHTIEMAQIKEINAKLKGRSGVVITAGELPLEAQPGDRNRPVDPSARLKKLSVSGSPSFPTSSRTSPVPAATSRDEAFASTPLHSKRSVADSTSTMPGVSGHKAEISGSAGIRSPKRHRVAAGILRISPEREVLTKI